MSDLSDVLNALVKLCATALYPTPPATPSTPSPVAGSVVSIYPGFPNPTIEADLKNGISHVTAFVLNGMTRITTRRPREWVADGPGPTSLTATVSDSTVTIGGAAGVAQIIGIKSLGVPYTYAASVTDTPATAAASLGALVPGATVSGAVITCPVDRKLLARVVGYATIRRELRRQIQGFRISCWCPSPAVRDLIAKTIDVTLARNPFIPLPDGMERLQYVAPDVNDVPSKSNLWRRDFRITVEYPTTEVMTAPAMLWGTVSTSTTNFT